ncbi:MAG: hypothetical protein U9Q08_04810 [Candidatus Omnitrophota bacterium]|nr:hypothetical protein [Candidatus Omnitrophota bacterium]
MVLFRNKVFNLALVISILWHLLCICGVRIELNPFYTHELKKYPAISFLGPILEETAFRRGLKIGLPEAVKVPLRKLFSDKLNLRSQFSNDQIRARGKKRIVTRQQAGSPDKHVLVESFDNLRQDSQNAPDYLPRVRLQGPVENRAVLYNPPLPSLPDWASQEGLRFDLKIKFWVSSQGVVKHAKPEISCGYPELDLLGIRYISKWRFGVLGSDFQQAGQWGIAKISLE